MEQHEAYDESRMATIKATRRLADAEKAFEVQQAVSLCTDECPGDTNGGKLQRIEGSDGRCERVF
jgi:hypothetical protein